MFIVLGMSLVTVAGMVVSVIEVVRVEHMDMVGAALTLPIPTWLSPNVPSPYWIAR